MSTPSPSFLHANYYLIPSSFHYHHTPLFSTLNPTTTLRRRRRRRRRPQPLKPNRYPPLRNQLGHFPENFLHLREFIAPLLNSPDSISPATLSFASAAATAATAALYFLRPTASWFHQEKKIEKESEIGEWVLFTSPTPFNRSVLLRCPSLAFEESESLEDVSQRLVKEDRHRVRLLLGNGSSDQAEATEAASDAEGDLFEFQYQRVCVAMDDGGVISLDWPANLDMKEEHGLDTTFLLIPGTPKGSSDGEIRSFVCESLRRGCFPIVMNPRGCAGSPLTTPRLFTAADSNDVLMAIQFIIKERPWSTLMGVGWGYGANMLTKYLAEVEDKTPLTAAACIDNPFDLEEATRLSPYQTYFDQEVTAGLIDIMRSNKGIFQGRPKKFDVQRAMKAKSVRDFEEAISMVSYGFHAIEDFYSKSSTSHVVGNLKIPVLFIQNERKVPLFSVPHISIADNPYTSLLLYSCLQSGEAVNQRNPLSWCEHIPIEWLMAVELGLLKGHHPLLEDVDINLISLKNHPAEGERESNKGLGVDKLLDHTQASKIIRPVDDPMNCVPSEGTSFNAFRRSKNELQKNSESGYEELQLVDSGTMQRITSETESVQNEASQPLGFEKGQALQTAEVVMNMLDITMPGTLKEQDKEKVLAAVDQGEALMKALQDAVPEHAREKLTTSVSAFLQFHSTNLDHDGFTTVSRFANMASTWASKVQEDLQGLSSSIVNIQTVDQKELKDDPVDSSDSKPLGPSKPSEEAEKSVEAESTISYGSGISTSSRKATDDSGRNIKQHESREKTSHHSDNEIEGSKRGAKPTSDTYEVVTSDATSAELDMKEKPTVPKNTEYHLDSSNGVDVINESIQVKEASSLDSQQMEMGSDSNQKEDGQPIQDVHDDKTSSFSVSQTLDALSDIDDSTQMAVNSVLGVIEDMITQLEGEENCGGVATRTELSNKKSSFITEDSDMVNVGNMEGKEDYKIKRSVQRDSVLGSSAYDRAKDCELPHFGNDIRLPTEKPAKTSISFNREGIDCFEDDSRTNLVPNDETEMKKEIIGGKLLARSFDRIRHVNRTPWHLAKIFGDSLCNQFSSNRNIKLNSSEQLDLDTTSALFLDYIPEDGQWKLLKQPTNFGDSIVEFEGGKAIDREIHAFSPPKMKKSKSIIESPYIVVGTDERLNEDHAVVENMNDIDGDKSEELTVLIKSVIFDALKAEVSRRVSANDWEEVDSVVCRDLEQVATTVASTITGNMDHHILSLDGKICQVMDIPKESDFLNEHILATISFSMHDTVFLRKILPVGVIVGSIFAALVEFIKADVQVDVGSISGVTQKKARNSLGTVQNYCEQSKVVQRLARPNGSSGRRNSANSTDQTTLNKFNDTVMVSAVTAYMGGSALLVHRQELSKDYETSESPLKYLRDKGDHTEPDEQPETKYASGVVTSFAEKAMAVASPVVPTKEHGQVDQERLVVFLTDLGQKGGPLKLVGNIALLWGGIRGAMSLTEKLILFLRISERPLYQRIVGFVGMILVLWSPVVVPLLPRLVQSWATHEPSRSSQLVAIIGLYTAISVLVVLWGRRIRGYQKPLQQYGLGLTSTAEVKNFLVGLIGGVMLILSIQIVNSLLGFVTLSWPVSAPSATPQFNTKEVCLWLALLKFYGEFIMLACQGIVTAIGLTVVEELVFRSWLPEEIASDLGYYHGIIISGLVFSLTQRSLQSIPGLWLLSLALAGVRWRDQGNLSTAIGLRTGIVFSSLVLKMGGFLKYQPKLHASLTGSQPFQPFSGFVGLVFSLLLAIVFFPRQPHYKKMTRTMRE